MRTLVCIDTSASTHGTRDRVARIETKGVVAVIHFGSRARVVAGQGACVIPKHKKECGSNLGEALAVASRFWNEDAGGAGNTVVFTDGKVNMGWVVPERVAAMYRTDVPVEFVPIGDAPDTGFLTAVHRGILAYQTGAG